MFQPKGKEPCLAIARRVYKKMPNSFYGSDFIKKIRNELFFQKVNYNDGTILRMLRLLRKEGANFECKDRSISLYLKLD